MDRGDGRHLHPLGVSDVGGHDRAGWHHPVLVARREVRLPEWRRAPGAGARPDHALRHSHRRWHRLGGPAAVKSCRPDFPLLAANPGLHYLDSAATTQKPAVVLDALRGYYEHDNANPHRGAYELSVRATDRYHEA